MKLPSALTIKLNIISLVVSKWGREAIENSQVVRKHKS